MISVIGCLVIRITFPPKMEMHHIHVSEMLKWTTFFHIGFRFCSVRSFLAAPAAALFYFVLLKAFTGATSAARRALRWCARMNAAFSPCENAGTRR